MALFGFGKRMEEETKGGCCCGSAPVQEVKSEPSCCCCGTDESNENCCGDDNGNVIVSIKVLGAGCKSCHEQYEAAKKAVEQLGLTVEVEYITDMEKVMTYGVMSMPAIVVNDQAVSMGKVLKPAEIIKLLGKLGY